MARAPVNVSHLQFVKLIPNQNFSRNRTESPYVSGLCALPDNVLLLACRKAGLRAFSLNKSKLIAQEIIREHVVQVAFDELTGTLLLLVTNATMDMWQLVSLRRNSSEWLEVTRLTTALSANNSLYVPVIAVCKSHVLVLRHREDDRMFVYNVSAEHSVNSAGNVSLGQQNWLWLACTRIREDSYIAISHQDPSFVALNRLVWTSGTPILVPIASYTLNNPGWLLFHKDLLLVSKWNTTTNSDAIVSLRASRVALSEKRELLAAANESGIDVRAWTFAGDRLVLWDKTSSDLRIYAFA